jgi:hypothetical protein
MAEVIDITIVDDVINSTTSSPIITVASEQVIFAVQNPEVVIDVTSISDVTIIDSSGETLAVENLEEILDFTFTEVQISPSDNVQLVKNYTAGEDIGGHRVVFMENGQWFYASDFSKLHIGSRVGITTGSAITGDPVNVQTFGHLTEGSWNFLVDKPIFLGDNGLITQSKPTVVLLTLGSVLTANTIYINIGQLIKLI